MCSRAGPVGTRRSKPLVDEHAFVSIVNQLLPQLFTAVLSIFLDGIYTDKPASYPSPIHQRRTRHFAQTPPPEVRSAAQVPVQRVRNEVRPALRTKGAQYPTAVPLPLPLPQLLTPHLQAHENKHTGARPHTCPLCPRRFSTTSNVARHLRTLHKSTMRSMATLSSQFSDSDVSMPSPALIKMEVDEDGSEPSSQPSWSAPNYRSS